MSLETLYDDLMHHILIKKGRNPSLFVKMLTDIKIATAMWKTITSDVGSTTASTSADELTIAGGDNISTTIVGDTLTIDGVATLTEITSITSPAALDLTLDAGSGEIDLSGDLIKNVGTVDGIDISIIALDNMPTAATGNIDCGAQAITNVGNVDGIDISAIKLNSMPTAANSSIDCNNQRLSNCTEIIRGIDTDLFSFFGGNGITNGAECVLIGDSRATNPGNAIFTYGGTPGTGDLPSTFSLRYRADDASLTITLTIDKDGKLYFPIGTSINEFSIDGTLAGNSDDAVPTEQATKTYVDTAVAGVAGVADTYYCDTQADIVAALTAIGAGAGTIILESGTIQLTSAITINIAGSVIIQGMGDLTVIDINGDYKCFDITGSASCILRDFKIDATDLTTVAREIIDITEGSDNKVIIDNITIVGDGTNGYGVFIDSDNCIVRDCDINNLDCGIRISFAGDKCIIENNMCYNNANAGIYINDGNINTVKGNICYNNNNGIFISAIIEGIFEGNICYDNTINGIYIQGSSFNTITGNNCYGNSQNGIYITAAGQNCITGNSCFSNDSNTANPQAGIYINTTCDKNTITGNTCNNNNNAGVGTGYGIYIANANDDDNTVMGNTALDNDTNYLDNGTNTFDSTTTDGDPLNNFVLGAG